MTTTVANTPYSPHDFKVLAEQHGDLLVAYEHAKRQWVAADRALQDLYARDPAAISSRDDAPEHEPEHQAYVAAKQALADQQRVLRDFEAAHPLLIEELTGRLVQADTL